MARILETYEQSNMRHYPLACAKPAIVISHGDINNYTLHELAQYHENYHEPFARMLGWNWANDVMYITDEYGIPYVFHVNMRDRKPEECEVPLTRPYYLPVFTLTLYGNVSSEWLGVYQFLKRRDYDNFDEWFYMRTNALVQHAHICALCSRPMWVDKRHIGLEYNHGYRYGKKGPEQLDRYLAGYHFASRYCNECYTGEIRRAAEAETYE